jgi:hypothetical protein
MVVASSSLKLSIDILRHLASATSSMPASHAIIAVETGSLNGRLRQPRDQELPILPGITISALLRFVGLLQYGRTQRDPAVA